MIEKIKTHIIDVISWIIGVAGVITTIISAYITDFKDMGYIYLILLSTETVLVILGVWSLKIQYSYEKQKQQLEKEIDNLEERIRNYEQKILDNQNSQILKKEEQKKYLCTLTTNIKNASKLNNELCNRIPELSEKSYHLLEALQANKINDKDVLKSEIIKAYEEFANGLFDLYKRYSSNLLNYIVEMFEAYLKLKGDNHVIASTIKLFDKPYFSREKNIDDIKVYTAFRDKKTYDSHEREIGEEPYTISGNADFLRCLRKEQFIINNAKRNSESYFNEHKDFDAYYNCAVVVALRVKLADNTYKFLGYLCCDCLNNDEISEVFDKESAQLLFSMAQIYSTFLETLESNWSDRVSDREHFTSFLDLIYKKTYVGKKK